MTMPVHIKIALRRFARKMFGLAVGTSLVAYFAYFAVYGDRGLITLLRLQEEIANSELVLSQLHQERESVERRTRLLREDSLDVDMLDERVRAVLNYTHPEDIVVVTATESPRVPGASSVTGLRSSAAAAAAAVVAPTATPAAVAPARAAAAGAVRAAVQPVAAHTAASAASRPVPPVSPVASTAAVTASRRPAAAAPAVPAGPFPAATSRPAGDGRTAAVTSRATMLASTAGQSVRAGRLAIDE